MNFLLQPKKYKSLLADDGSRAIMDKTIAFFETMGKTRLTEDFNKKVWYREFVDFIAGERIFAKLLTPRAYAGGDPDCRWDTARNSEYSELLAFYGLGYWYCFQVTILGLGPIWMSGNEAAKRRAAELLKQGAIFAFGLSERAHGADIYATETTLTPAGDGTWKANGEKYYIGNGNEAEMVSTLGKVKDGTDDYAFFVTNYRHKAYELKKNVISHQEYVSNFALHDYPIGADDLLSRGPDAWDAALNTVNIGKFNIGPASIGVAEHCFYEAITHAANRVLYGMRVTDMPHVRKNFMDAWLRLVGMKLYQRRATDYFRNASESDRRYLLYNPTSKMKVTLQAEEVINLLWDVIAAKGFEKDTFFSMGAVDIRGPSKLEGTVHVNVQLIRKFMQNYFFNPAEYAPVAPDVSRQGRSVSLPPGTDQGPGRGPVPRLHVRPSRPTPTCPTWRPSSGRSRSSRKCWKRPARTSSRTWTPRSPCRWARCSRSWSTASSSSNRPDSTASTPMSSTRSSTSWCATSPVSPCRSTACTPPGTSSGPSAGRSCSSGPCRPPSRAGGSGRAACCP